MQHFTVTLRYRDMAGAEKTNRFRIQAQNPCYAEDAAVDMLSIIRPDFTLLGCYADPTPCP